jgi:hypothetical protein
MTTTDDPRYPGAYRALVASLGDDSVSLPVPIITSAVLRVLDRLDATEADTVTALRKQVAELEEDSRTLRALEAGGVDNWDGYSDALADLGQEQS